MTVLPGAVEILAAQAVVLFVILSDPALMTLRAGLRRIGGAPAHRHAPAVRAGLLLAASAALWIETARGGSPLIPAAALVAAMLAGCDLAWRWLPPAWSGALGLCGLLAAAAPVAGLGAAILCGGTLLILRLALMRGGRPESLGLGDVWLTAAVAVWLGPLPAMAVLGVAATTALLIEGARVAQWVGADVMHRRLGAAFGAHICAAFAAAALIST